MPKLSEVAKRRPTGKVTLDSVEFVVQMVPASVAESIVRALPEPVAPTEGYAKTSMFQNDKNRCAADRRCMLFLSALDVEGQIDDDDRWTAERNGDWCRAHARTIREDFTEAAITTVVHIATYKLAFGAEKVEIGSEDAEGN